MFTALLIICSKHLQEVYIAIKMNVLFSNGQRELADVQRCTEILIYQKIGTKVKINHRYAMLACLFVLYVVRRHILYISIAQASAVQVFK